MGFSSTFVNISETAQNVVLCGIEISRGKPITNVTEPKCPLTF